MRLLCVWLKMTFRVYVSHGGVTVIHGRCMQLSVYLPLGLTEHRLACSCPHHGQVLPLGVECRAWAEFT
jgi:nitrite reductase/ring-hydroxylating ferredoxin subunit